jgi:hypothetical protein
MIFRWKFFEITIRCTQPTCWHKYEMNCESQWKSDSERSSIQPFAFGLGIGTRFASFMRGFSCCGKFSFLGATQRCHTAFSAVNPVTWRCLWICVVVIPWSSCQRVTVYIFAPKSPALIYLSAVTRYSTKNTTMLWLVPRLRVGGKCKLKMGRGQLA